MSIVILPVIGAFLFGWAMGDHIAKEEVKYSEPIVIEREVYKCHKKDLHTCKMTHGKRPKTHRH